jgi:hypothetical protein
VTPAFLLPPSLPQRHLARFVVEVIDGLDLSELIKAYRGSGSASYHPAMLLGLLVYGYATKVFSSRAIERATHDSVAFRYIAGNEHPDHDSISNADNVRLSSKKKQVDAAEIGDDGPKPDSDLEAANIILRELLKPVFSVLNYRLLWVGFLLGVVAASMDFIGSGAAHRILADAPLRITIANCVNSSSDPHMR